MKKIKEEYRHGNETASARNVEAHQKIGDKNLELPIRHVVKSVREWDK